MLSLWWCSEEKSLQKKEMGMKLKYDGQSVALLPAGQMVHHRQIRGLRRCKCRVSFSSRKLLSPLNEKVGLNAIHRTAFLVNSYFVALGKRKMMNIWRAAGLNKTFRFMLLNSWTIGPCCAFAFQRIPPSSSSSSSQVVFINNHFWICNNLHSLQGSTENRHFILATQNLNM